MNYKSAERWARLGTRIGIGRDWVWRAQILSECHSANREPRPTKDPFPETLNVVAVYMSQSRSGYTPYGNYGIRID